MRLDFFSQLIADLRQPLDLYAALRPMSFICLMSGISPFKIVGALGNRHLAISNFGLVNSVLHIVWFCLCYVLRVFNRQSLLSYLFNSKVSRFGENIQVVTSFMAIGLTMILCILKRGKLLKLLHMLTYIDGKFIDFGANINYKMTSRLVWFMLVVQWLIKLAFVGVTFMLVGSLENAPGFSEWIFFFLPFAIMSTLKAKYVCMMRLIKNRFNYINLILIQLRECEGETQRCEIVSGRKKNRFNEFTCDVEKMNGGVEFKREKGEIIAELCRRHEDLCDACDLAEQYFSHQILTTVTIEFVVSLFNFYFMFDVAYNENSIGIDRTIFFAYFIFYTTITTTTLYVLVRSAEAVTSEVGNWHFFPSMIYFSATLNCMVSSYISEQKVRDFCSQNFKCAAPKRDLFEGSASTIFHAIASSKDKIHCMWSVSVE